MHFGDCRLDLDARRLFRGSREVRLSPKAFELLRLLVEKRPRALSKNELLERVWPGVFVSDASLARVVNEIRTGVGDRAREATIVRTVHGFGYSFAAVVETDDPDKPADEGGRDARYWLTVGAREFSLGEGAHVIGREPGVAVWIDSPKISRRHAQVNVRESTVSIEDLGSKNGTFVRGVRLEAATRLESGDVIRVGACKLVFHVAGEPVSPTETQVGASASE